MSIKNISALRDHAIETLEKLEKGRIDVMEAVANARLYDSMLHSSKLEMSYHKMLGQKPEIKFLEGAKTYVHDVKPQILGIEQKKKK